MVDLADPDGWWTGIETMGILIGGRPGPHAQRGDTMCMTFRLGIVLIALVSLATQASGQAQTAPHDQRFAAAAKGIYVASFPLLAPKALLPDAVYASPHVSGVYIRLVWARVEPRPGEYDFSLLDAELRRAVASGKRISLSIITGAHAPRWLPSQGIAARSFRVGRGGQNRQCLEISMALPWDQGYQKAYAALLRAVADHIRSIPAAWDLVRIVKLTGIGRFTEELRLPADFGDGEVCGNTTSTRTWLEAGYTDDRIVGAWVSLAEAVAHAFPDQLLAQDVLERNDFPTSAEAGSRGASQTVKARIIEAARKLYPNRLALQWNGLTATGGLSETVLAAGRTGVHFGWQSNAFRGFDGAGCNPSRRTAAETCSPDQYKAILQNGVSTGADYIEVWPTDAVAFGEAIGWADQALRTTVKQ